MADPARNGAPPGSAYLDYAEFGRRFFETAVTRERVAKAVGDLSGRPIDVGPMNVAPLGFVKVRARGQIGEPAVRHRPDPLHVAYHLIIPASLRMEIQIGLESYRFDADTAINLKVTARAIEPLRIYIDVAPPTPADIDVDLQADGRGASLIEKLAGVEREVRRNVVTFVSKEIDKTEQNRIIDIAGTVAGGSAPRQAGEETAE